MAVSLNQLLQGMEERGRAKGEQKPKPVEGQEPPKKKPVNLAKFRAVSAIDFLKLNIPPRVFLMEPWLPSQGLAMIYAPRGIGKTFFALEIAHAIARGGEFLKWKAAEPKSVLYIDGEMCAPDLQDRVRRIVNRSGEPEHDLFKILTPDLQRGAMPNLSDRESQKDLDALLEGVKLVVVDNISTLCRGGKENEADSWQTVQDWALRLRASGISVLFIHHAGKGGGQRGTSKREDVLDTVIALKRPNDYQAKEGARFEVHFEKSRGFSGADAEPFEVQLEPSETEQLVWKWTEMEESAFEKVVRLTEDGLSQTEIATELGLNKSTVSRHFNRAKQEGLV